MMSNLNLNLNKNPKELFQEILIEEKQKGLIPSLTTGLSTLLCKFHYSLSSNKIES